MPLTIERLRLAIVALAVLLLLTIAGSFFYGRWRLRRIAQDLPARLGIQIQQSTRDFVLSKTAGGRPLFTLHAARAVEFKSGGHVTLHDVEIDLYNRQDGKADTIAGSDFEYDPRSQIVQSQGEAHIVLHAPATNARTGTPNKEAGQVVRVTTHGLTFNQKTGVATCSGEVDFQIADSSGQAVGAEYDSKQGHLTLQSQIVLTTTMQNYPAVLHASHALYDRSSGDIHLWQPQYTSRTQSGTMSGTAGTATVQLRANGSVEQLDAQNNVRLNSANGLAVRAPVMHVLLNESNQPKDAHFSGGVEFAENDPAQKTSGNSQEMDVEFDARGRADHVVLDGEVQIHQQADAGKTELQRTLASNHLVMNLLPTRTGQAQLQSADATGNAVFTSRSTVPGHASQQTTLAAQTLKANFAAGNQLQQINGAGQTLLKTVAANGDIDSSSGDTLQIDFAPSQSSRLKKAAASESGPLAAQSIRTVVQTGNVILRQAGNGKNGDASGPQISTATAARASYMAANDTLTLTGDPVFRNAQLEMTAHRMEFNHTTGRMVSTGAVQTTLRPGDQSTGGQPGGAGGLLDGKQPVHIIADHAVFAHDTQTAVFSGHARLWQGGDTVEAPVINLSQKMQVLTAYSDRPCAQCVVSNFLGGPAASAPATKQKQGVETGMPSTFRVLSERLVYSDAERKASFIHHVQVVCSSGVLYADNAEIFLTPVERNVAASGKGRKTGEKISTTNRNNTEPSSVERIVATGRVRLEQPGRSATGTKLVYTAADEHFVLTGDEKNPPQVVDLDHGTVTGQILTFASREQAIIVSGTLGHTTTTRTRVQKK